MLIDSVMFLNEIEILESRINYLCGLVDKFFIVESNVSFNGQPKPLFFLENEKKFCKWKHRIIYQPYIFDKNIFSKETNSKLNIEFLQRNSIVNYVKNYFDKSIRIIINNINEIPNKEVVMDGFRKLSLENPALTFEQESFNYNFNKNQGKYPGSVITSLDFLCKHSPQWIRENRSNFNLISNGGWKLCNFNNNLQNTNNNVNNISSLPESFLKHFSKHEVMSIM